MSDTSPTWEYHVGLKLDEAALNALGEQGWQLVSVAGPHFYLKRPGPSFRDRVTLEQKQRYYALWSASDETAPGAPS